MCKSEIQHNIDLHKINLPDTGNGENVSGTVGNDRFAEVLNMENESDASQKRLTHLSPVIWLYWHCCY